MIRIITSLLLLLAVPIVALATVPAGERLASGCLSSGRLPVDRLSVEHLSTDQGLSQSIVYCVFQDREGFLWFDTRDGLNRYDGYRFTIFRHDPFDSASLPSTSVSAITQDADGKI